MLAAGARVTLTAVAEGTATIRPTATDPGSLTATRVQLVPGAGIPMPPEQSMIGEASLYTGPTSRHDAMTTATPRRDPEARPQATYQDVLDAPPHEVAEIVDGLLCTNPRPAAPHALASSLLGYYLMGPFQVGQGGPGGWWIIDEPELHLGDDVLVPDIAGWRRARMPIYPETAYVALSPDWVCEILSPSTRKLDLEAKRPVRLRRRSATGTGVKPEPGLF